MAVTAPARTVLGASTVRAKVGRKVSAAGTSPVQQAKRAVSSATESVAVSPDATHSGEASAVRPASAVATTRYFSRQSQVKVAPASSAE